MACYHPISAYMSLAAGRKVISTKAKPDSKSIRLPCGRCIGCRLERSRQWAVRLMHELKSHEKSSFLTLTFDDDHLPYPPSLDSKLFQRFMKRLRKWQASCTDDGRLRFFHCGEYGDENGRPHYHVILFGQDFSRDRRFVKKTDRGDDLYESDDLGRAWPFGNAWIGDVTFESCAYVARYITKKVTGRKAREHYQWIDGSTGEVFDLKPEYATMSRNPGIGAKHFERFQRDIYPSDEVIVRGRSCKPPKFYDRRLEQTDPEMYQLLKEQREFALEQDLIRNGPEYSEARLAVKETVKLAQIQSLKRKL